MGEGKLLFVKAHGDEVIPWRIGVKPRFLAGMRTEHASHGGPPNAVWKARTRQIQTEPGYERAQSQLTAEHAD